MAEEPGFRTPARELEKIKEVGVSPLLVDTLDDNFKARCDLVDEAFRRKRR